MSEALGIAQAKSLPRRSQEHPRPKRAWSAWPPLLLLRIALLVLTTAVLAVAKWENVEISTVAHVEIELTAPLQEADAAVKGCHTASICIAQAISSGSDLVLQTVLVHQRFSHLGELNWPSYRLPVSLPPPRRSV